MGDAWLDSAERVANAKAGGGTYVAGAPWRFVGHTTEVVPSSPAGARALAGRHEYPPHLWGWPEEDLLLQTVRLDRSAFALKHPQGTPETNKMGALQLEVFGYAAQSPNKPPEFWDWIGRRVVRPLIDAGYPLDLTKVAPTTGGDGYGVGGAVRMSRAQWASFDGLCVHANVPDNEHWDMGAADMRRVALAAAPGGGDDMFEDSDRVTLRRVEDLLDLLVPRGALWAMTSGDELGKVVPAGTPGAEKVSDVWRYLVYLQEGGSDKLVANIAEGVVAALPPASGGGGITAAQVEAACRKAVDAELGFLKAGK